ncbi:MAG: sensor histidine kinase [Spirochaetales bacterium]
MEKPTGLLRLEKRIRNSQRFDFTGHAYVTFHAIAILIGLVASAWSLSLGAVYHFAIAFFFSIGLVISLLLFYYIGDNASRVFALSIVPTGVMILQVVGVLFVGTEFEFRIFPAAFALVSITLAGFAGRSSKLFAWSAGVAGMTIGTLEWYFVRQGQSTVVEALLMLALFGFSVIAAYEFMLTRRQLVRSRELAEEASRLKSRFISNMSHEIRTPLAGILGLTSLLPMTESDYERERIIARLRETTDALRQQVDEMLDFQKLQTSEDGAVVLSSVVIPDFIEQCIGPYRQPAEQRGVAFYFRPTDEPKAEVLLDRRRVRTALEDIMANAVKFTLSGWIVVTVSSLLRDSGGGHASWFHVSVSDTGVGMSEGVQRQVLQPFVQGDDGYSKRFPGKGLGLARASLALRQAGGTLNIVSTPGSGTTVAIEIPVSTEA